MAKIKLVFVRESEQLSLFETEFTGDTPGAYAKCVRGAVSHCGYGTFPWSKAVKALALLLLKAAARNASRAGNERPAMLAGGGATPAASLDYAIGKKPHWFCEMFGRNGGGEPYALRLLGRTNAERKRPGPVRVILNTRVLSSIEVFVDGSRIESPDDLATMMAAIERDWLPTPRTVRRRRQKVTPLLLQRQLAA